MLNSDFCENVPEQLQTVATRSDLYTCMWTNDIVLGDRMLYMYFLV